MSNSIYDRADNLSPEARRSNAVIPAEGHYPELVVLEVPSVADKGAMSFYKAALRVLTSGTETPAGSPVDFFETVAGSQYPDYDIKALARVKRFVGAANGLAGEDCRREVTGQVIVLSKHEGQPLRGRVVSADVSYERDRAGKIKMRRAKAGRPETPFVTFSFAPVLDEKGQPKTVSLGAYEAPKPAAAPAAPPPPPAAPAAPVVTGGIPEGWLAHPTAPGFMYRGQEVAKIPA